MRPGRLGPSLAEFRPAALELRKYPHLNGKLDSQQRDSGFDLQVDISIALVVRPWLSVCRTLIAVLPHPLCSHADHVLDEHEVPLFGTTPGTTIIFRRKGKERPAVLPPRVIGEMHDKTHLQAPTHLSPYLAVARAQTSRRAFFAHAQGKSHGDGLDLPKRASLGVFLTKE